MPFFNRNHASRGFEALAMVSGVFACLAIAEHLTAGTRSAQLIILLVLGTFSLAILAAASRGGPRVAVRALLTGPFIASVLFAAAVIFTDEKADPVLPRLAVAGIFGACALVMFLVLRKLRTI